MVGTLMHIILQAGTIRATQFIMFAASEQYAIMGITRKFTTGMIMARTTLYIEETELRYRVLVKNLDFKIFHFGVRF